ncbi:hypothetical protein EF405_02560 [Cyclobacteriaceae bacterium YHN15]|jgi:hypothetical protein|nr:hypothetical protein EF405_02560 [Cyclobacteriaceae bacterium YHN15]
MKDQKKLKNLLLLSTLVFLFSSEVFAQSSFYGKIYYGISDAALLPKEEMLGGGLSYDPESFREFGFLLGKELSKKWAIEAGLNSAAADFKYLLGHNMLSSQESTILPPSERFRMLSFPVLMRYSIFPFLYVNAGPMLDIQRTENPEYNQSGIGYLLGIGAEHYFKKVGVFIHPHFKRHATIPFESTNYNLTEFGVQLGVAYRF